MAARATSPFVEKEYDELDRKIDGFLGRIGAIFRGYRTVVSSTCGGLGVARREWDDRHWALPSCQ